MPVRISTELTILCYLIGTAPVSLAQPTAGATQPDRLQFGVVRPNAIVEGSFRVFENGKDATKVKHHIETPDFVDVTDVTLGTQTYGKLGTMVYCDVSIQLRTDQLGDGLGTVEIRLGEQKVSLPVSVEVRPKQWARSRLLVVATPFDKFSTGNADVFAPWLQIVKGAKLDVSYLDVIRGQPVLRDLDLNRFDVILLAETGVVFAQESDLKRLTQFVRAGGRVITAANSFFVGTVPKANKLLEPLGLLILDREIPQPRLTPFKIDGVAEDPLTRGVERLAFFRASPIEILQTETTSLLVPYPLQDGLGIVAVARVGKGEVIALGQALWWNWIGTHGQGSDNARLLTNLVSREKD